MTLRALEVLAHVNLIAAEDKRTSAKLLNYYEIKTPLTSYHDFNKEKITPVLLNKLVNELSVALITDAGTPGISDPAFYIVREAINKGINVEAVPGATAFVPALITSGLPTDRFVFEGFLPVKKGRQKRLEELKTEPRTIILYESPNRVQKTLNDLYFVFGDRKVVISREITKKFEQIIRGHLSDLINEIKEITLKGEFVLIIEGLSREIQKRIKFKEKAGI
ncbi:16S rRNA (cytidine(1402)-2'-O)-methyltransferase [candidate division KSB1 bacterium]|nr:16S rRNA (cytidine(1402)-2'-O)-methyltransferase [candidate division KSB1 bacterium]